VLAQPCDCKYIREADAAAYFRSYWTEIPIDDGI